MTLIILPNIKPLEWTIRDRPLDFRNSVHETPLILAAQGNLNVCITLLENGADIVPNEVGLAL